MLVLLATTGLGAAFFGLTGALVGYLVGMVASSMLPEAACRVPPREDPAPPAPGTDPTRLG